MIISSRPLPVFTHFKPFPYLRPKSLDMKTLLTAAIFAMLLLAACDRKPIPANDENSYYAELTEWKANRLERLKSRTGWLNLAGLYWLSEGENSFGSDSSNTIVFPEKAAAFCGTIVLEKGSCTLHALPASAASHDSLPVRDLKLSDDHSGKPTLIEMGDLAWYIIKRDSLYGIRLRDYASPAVEALHEIPSFPADTRWVIAAKYMQYKNFIMVDVPTAIGTFESYKCPGELQFRLNGRKQRLQVFSEGRDFFIIFSDGTSGKESYGAGRYLSAAFPDSTGQVILDFNRATNPPCAFTPFATCPMPPRANMLKVEIKAGEKNPGH